MKNSHPTEKKPVKWYRVFDQDGRPVPGYYQKPRAEEIAESRRQSAPDAERVRIEFAEAGR